MSSRHKKKGKTRSGQQGINFVVTLITLSIIFIFVGYLLGQYAVRMLQAQHTYKVQMTQKEEEAPVSPVVASPRPQPLVDEGATGSSEPEPSLGTLYRVQVGVFSEKQNADRMVVRLKELGYDAIIVDGPPYRVQTGAFSSQENANRFSEELKSKGFEVIVVR